MSRLPEGLTRCPGIRRRAVLKNGSNAGKDVVTVPLSNFTASVVDALARKGYVKPGVKKGKTAKKTLEVGLIYVNGKARITDVKRLSKPSKRLYKGYSDIHRVVQGRNKVSPGGKYDMACNNLAVICARKGRIKEAIYLYKESIAINNCSLAYENLGELYNSLGMHKDAALILEKGAVLCPLNVNILYQLGVAYYASKEFGQAKQMFLKVERIQENYSDTTRFLRLLENL